MQRILSSLYGKTSVLKLSNIFVYCKTSKVKKLRAFRNGARHDHGHYDGLISRMRAFD